MISTGFVILSFASFSCIFVTGLPEQGSPNSQELFHSIRSSVNKYSVFDQKKILT